jgi:Winged helix DNA-binding domain
MNRSDLARLRLHNQQLILPSFCSPADVVRWFGAIQSQDLSASLYAIGLRMSQATEAVVEQALANRSIVRSWPMRRTIHCMAAEDARWMIRMLTPRGIARMTPYHRKMGIDDRDLRRAAKVFEKALSGDRQVTRIELYQKLNSAGVRTDTPDGQTRGLHLLCHWAQAGLICIAARQGKQPAFALLEDWTPRGRDLSGDEAFAELARRYFQSHAPATLRDFAWWSGFTQKDASRALSMISNSLRSVQVDGIEYWLLRNATYVPAGTLPVLVLPVFDEYTVGYADRSMAADHAVLPTIGHGLAANILVDGRIAGTWRRTLNADGTVTITPALLRSLNRLEQAGLTRAAARYAAFLGKALASENSTRPDSRRRRLKGKRPR